MKQLFSLLILSVFLTTANAQPFFVSPIPSGDKCAGINTTYRAPSGKTNYQWTITGTAGTDYAITSGGLGTTNSFVILKWLTTGAKTLTINWTGSGGSPAGSTVTEWSTPTASFTTHPAANLCPNDTAIYITQGNNTSSTWNVANFYPLQGGTSTDSFLVGINANPAGNQTVTVSYTDIHGCKSTTATNSTNVYDQVCCFTTAPDANPTIGEDQTYTSFSGMTNYTWGVTGVNGVDYTITGGGLGTTDATVTLRWATTTTQQVGIIFTDTNGCTEGTGVSYPVTPH